MSTDSIRSRLDSLARAVGQLHDRMAASRKKEANAVTRIGMISRSITRSTSAAALQTKQREIQGWERQIEQEKQAQAKIAHELAAKEKERLQCDRALREEHEKQHKRALKVLDEGLRRRTDTFLREARGRIPLAASGGAPKEHDMFICHAADDKEDFVRPLVDRLIAAKVDVWYDDFTLKVGDSLRRSIDAGLARSRFGVVVLSPAFFAKNWPQYELDGLFAKEMGSGSKVVLPIWHKVSKDEVMRASPTLADRVALLTAALSVDEIAAKLIRMVEPG